MDDPDFMYRHQTGGSIIDPCPELEFTQPAPMNEVRAARAAHRINRQHWLQLMISMDRRDGTRSLSKKLLRLSFIEILMNVDLDYTKYDRCSYQLLS